MVTRIKSKRIITPEGFVSGYVYFDKDQILGVNLQEQPWEREYDFGNQMVSPGFVDIHVHGGNGFDFCRDDAEGDAAAINLHLAHGTTTIVPTLCSVDFAAIDRSLGNIQECIRRGLNKANICGVHLEGPYFSPKQSGAQNPDHLVGIDREQYTTLIKKYGNLIKRWSYAPELDTDCAFTKYLAENNIVAAMGHTDAIYDECMAAFAEGCRLVTHLYSCTSTITRKGGFRRLGVIETAYLQDDMDVEIIADGRHLPPELIRLICKIKGYDRVTLVTDAMSAAGSDAKEAEIGGMPCIIEDGVAKLPDRSAFAGSIATADRLLRVCVQEAGIPLLSALKMLTSNPARIMGINAGEIRTGARPDFVVLSDMLQVMDVFVGGKAVEL